MAASRRSPRPAPDPALLAADAWGVHRHWVDADDELQEVADDRVDALRAAIGTPPDDLDERAPLVVRPGGRLDTGPVEVTLETGETVDVGDELPDDFPLGYHWVTTPSGLRRRLVVSPGRCWLPEQRAWGWTVQLYAARSSASWGMGDLGDLRAVREWAQRENAGFLLVNPLHAVAPTLPQEASPYLPATRRFLNPIYLRVEEAPGAELADLADLAARGRALNDAPLVDRDEVWTLKDQALRRVYAVGERADDFEQWREEQPGGALTLFATWSALARELGPDWHDWPEPLRDPSADAVSAYAAEHDDEVGYFAWLQWLLREQLHRATGDLTVVQDLPIGVSGGGFDAWAWQGLLADRLSVGAPPDLFNAAGQHWGAPPLVPWRLREDNYEAFAQTVRATIAGAGGLRIDHVMGLFRLWWLPSDGSPRDGAYVRYPSDDLLDIVALESYRARAVVVGEDLGTVEEGVREALAERGMLSYRLLYFEEDDPADWPEQSLAAVTTHDLPTVTGLWSGADAQEQQEYAGLAAEAAERDRRALMASVRRGALPDSASAADAVREAYRLVGQSPCRFLSATLEDAVGEARRPNMPGTTGRPNWCLPLAVRVEDLADHPGVAAVAEALRTASVRC